MVGCHRGIKATALAPNKVIMDVQKVAGASRPRNHFNDLRGAGVLADTRPLNTALTTTLALATRKGPTLVAPVEPRRAKVPAPPPLVAPSIG